MYAVLKGRLDVVRMLLDEYHVSPHQTGTVQMNSMAVSGISPLMCAALVLSVPIVELLLERGAAVNAIDEACSPALIVLSVATKRFSSVAQTALASAAGAPLHFFSVGC